MRRLSRIRNHSNTRTRTLRLEGLEARQLLAVSPFPFAAEPVAAEAQVSPAKTVCGVAFQAIGTDPAMNAHPENDAPRILKPNDWICPAIDGGPRGDPHKLDPAGGRIIPPELGMPEEIDPRKVPGRGCPEEREGGCVPFDDWFSDAVNKNLRNDAIDDRYNVFTDPGYPRDYCPYTDSDGVIHLGDTEITVDTDDGEDGNSDGSDGDTGDTCDTADDGVIVWEDCDEDGSNPDAERDSDPEGDDPDELRFDPSIFAIAEASRGGSGRDHGCGYVPSISTANVGPPKDDPDRQGQEGPEDGRPDELKAIGKTAAVDSMMAVAYACQPGPDTGDPGGPDDPRASDGTTTVSGAFPTASAAG